MAKWQRSYGPLVALGAVPFKPVHYDTVEEMESYITSPDYKSSRKIKGICYGFQQHIKDAAPNNYTFSFHFPDKKVGLSKIGYEQGVPD